MDKVNETCQASPNLENPVDDAVNPSGSGQVLAHDFSDRAEYLAAAPLRFKPGTTLETAESIHRYARIFGGGSVNLMRDEAGMRLALTETRDRQLMLDQFSDHLD